MENNGNSNKEEHLMHIVCPECAGEIGMTLGVALLKCKKCKRSWHIEANRERILLERKTES